MSYLSGDLDEHQQRTFRDYIRKDALEHQASLDHQGIDLELSIPTRSTTSSRDDPTRTAITSATPTTAR
ncbi:hypothetical protein [Streptomyces sp. MZ04]|uniref:hypothetical protein n=1 Tax=Streptomyces sp. MZ04 TaxID=2559236 RepID=UPI00107EB16A|nr:hypothetical protein [Streptomyces sp. MZ04]TGB16026.1 hypothetical protein E2651_00815 [Streptomyces sp. MZ04]